MVDGESSMEQDTRRAVRHGIYLVGANSLVLLMAGAAVHRRLWAGPPDYSNIVAICVLISTIVVGMLAILPNLKSLRWALEDSAESMRSSHYSELDKIYMNSLLIALDKPYLREPQAITDEQQRSQYDIYAFLVWNFLETVRDRSEKHSALQRTWGPIIVSEARLHWAWFQSETTGDNSLDSPKFCAEFCDFIHRHHADDFRAMLDRPENDENWRYREVKYDETNKPWFRCPQPGSERGTVT